MKRRSTLFLLIALFTGTVCQAASLRTWTAIDGRTIEARFVSGDYLTVTVQKKDDVDLAGKPRNTEIRLAWLSEPDKEYVAAVLKKLQSFKSELEKLKKSYPPNLSELRSYQSNGPTTARFLAEQHSVYDAYYRMIKTADVGDLGSKLEVMRAKMNAQLRQFGTEGQGRGKIAVQADVNHDWIKESLEPYYKKLKALSDKINEAIE